MVKEISVATRKTCFSLREKDITLAELKLNCGIDVSYYFLRDILKN